MIHDVNSTLVKISLRLYFRLKLFKLCKHFLSRLILAQLTFLKREAIETIVLKLIQIVTLKTESHVVEALTFGNSQDVVRIVLC